MDSIWKIEKGECIGSNMPEDNVQCEESFIT